MSKKRKSRKPNNHNKRINRMCVGLIMRWFDSDPLSQKPLKISDVTVTHESPVFRAQAMQFWQNNAEYLRSKSSWAWEITLTSLFEWDKTTQHESRVLTARCVIADIAEHVNTAINDMMKYGDESRYIGTQFNLKCTGF